MKTTFGNEPGYTQDERYSGKPRRDGAPVSRSMEDFLKNAQGSPTQTFDTKPASPDVLQTLGPELNTKAPGNNVQQLADVGNSAQIAPNMQKANNIGVKADQGMSAMKDVLKQARADLNTAAGIEGIDLNAVHPDTRMAANNEIGMLGNLAMQGMPVAPAVKIISNGANFMDTIMNERQSMKGLTPKQADARIESRLREMSAGAESTASSGAFTMAAGPKPAQPQTNLDWNKYFEKGGTVKDIMNVDINHPVQLKTFREMLAVRQTVDKVENKLEGDDKTKFDKFDAQEVALQTSHGNTKAVKQMLEGEDEDIDADDIRMASYALRNNLRMKGLDLPDAAFASEGGKPPALNLENQLLAAAKPSFSNVLGA